MAAKDGKRGSADKTTSHEGQVGEGEEEGDAEGGASQEGPVEEVGGAEEGKITLKARLFFFFLPLLIAAAWIAGLLLLMPLDQSGYIVAGMTAYSFTPAGPEIVVPFVTRQVMENGGNTFWHPAIVATSLAFVDIVFAMFFMWNFDLLLKIPLIGPWMAKVERIGKRKLSDRPWVHKFALLGLIVYTMFPFQGSGGAVGSIFGRILGMGKRRVFAAITVGAFAGAFPFAYLTYYGVDAADRFLTDEQKIIGAAVFFIIIIAAMIHLSREEDRLYGDGADGNGKTWKDGEGRKAGKTGKNGESRKKGAGKDGGKGQTSRRRKKGKNKKGKEYTGGVDAGDVGKGEAPDRND